jgi:hypothetical protein
MLCSKVCTHGGVCDLDEGHNGQHSASGYCTWNGDSGLSAEEADDMFRIKSAEQGIPSSIVEFVIDVNQAKD